MVWGTDKRPWSWYFRETNQRYPHSYQVWRPQFDQLLLENSRAHGVEVREGHQVVDVLFEAGRACGVRYTADGVAGMARARFVVDASGRARSSGTSCSYAAGTPFFRTWQCTAILLEPSVCQRPMIRIFLSSRIRTAGSGISRSIQVGPVQGPWSIAVLARRACVMPLARSFPDGPGGAGTAHRQMLCAKAVLVPLSSVTGPISLMKWWAMATSSWVMPPALWTRSSLPACTWL